MTVILRYLLLTTSIFMVDVALARINVYTYIPKQAYYTLPIVKCVRDKILPDFQYKGYFGGLIEQESCIYLTHKRCWNPKSKLSTKRELGIGLGQLTKAYKKDGSVRFDSLKEIRKRHLDELRELSWETIESRPDLQIKAIIYMSKSNYDQLYNVKDDYARLAMSDAAYNGGLRGVFRDRRICGLTKGCDVNKWFDNVEKHCSKSKRILYGNRNACDINREHVDSVLKIRMKKYVPYLK